MSGKRQKTQQFQLAFMSEGRGEAPTADVRGAEPPTAKRSPESPAGTEQWMEAVCDRENLWKALKHVRANKGSAGIDGMRELTRRTRGISVGTMVEQLSSYLRGWGGYFGFCQTPSVLRDLNSWIHRRLRCFQWKQWKRGRRRFAELVKRGVSRYSAAVTAGAPHGPWRISRCPALQQAMPNAFWAQLGLPHLTAR